MITLAHPIPCCRREHTRWVGSTSTKIRLQPQSDIWKINVWYSVYWVNPFHSRHGILVNYHRIGSGNGLAPAWCQAIAWTNADSLSIESLGINFSEVWLKIQQYLYNKMDLKMLSAKCQPFCSGLNTLKEKETQHSFAGLFNIYISGIWLWDMPALFINGVKQNRCQKSENPQPMVVTILPPCSGKQMWMWCSVVSSLLDGS